MYSERNSGINWLNILIKGVFVVFFILLIIWLFPKVPNMKPFYSNVFRENISYMQDAAESYFTDDKMPKNVGDSVEITLGEMIDKNIILPFVDKDGKECDSKASYVQIVKNNDDYTMTVNLVCPSEKNTLKKTLACHTYCENCDKKSVAVEYQYRQPVTTNKTELSCPKGGTLKDGMCYVYENKTYKALEKTTGGTLYCNSGDTLKDGKCIKTTTYTANTASNGSYYSCNGNDKLSGSTCTTTKEVEVALRTSTTTSYEQVTDYKYGFYTTKVGLDGYSCDYDFVTKDQCSTCKATRQYYYNCQRTRNVAVENTESSCPAGSYSKNGKCYKSISTTYEATLVSNGTHLYCNGNDTRNGNTCTHTETYAASKKDTKVSYSCPNGGDLKDKNCVVNTLKESYKATSTTKKVTTYNYKWSQEETLTGWVKTGKTREITK